MLRFHRTTYTVNGQLRQASWWQLGDHILRHREYLV